MGKDHHRAARDGTNEIGLAVMATTFAIVAVFAPVAFMGGIIGKFFYPFGITVVVAVLVSLFVSFTLDPMLSSVWKDPPSAHLKKLPVIGHAIRATDRLMDLLHARLRPRHPLDLFSARRWRVWLPAWARAFDADGMRDKASPRRWRRATITPRGVVMAVGVGSFVAALGAGTAGRQRVRARDRPELHAAGAEACRWAAAWTAPMPRCAQIEAIVKALPEVKHISHLDRRRRASATRPG